MDIDIDDHSDQSVHYTYNDYSTFIVDGDRYSNTYVYRDRDGKTYRGHDLDCIDFDNQADAQAVLDAVGSDLYWLDADRDGIACEANLGEFTRDVASSSGVRRGGQISVLPSGSVDTGRRR